MKFNFTSSVSKRAAYASVIGGAFFMILAACTLLTSLPFNWLAVSQSREAAGFWPNAFQALSQASLACGGWLLVFAGLLLAGYQASRGWMLDAMQELDEDEGGNEQGDAKSQIADASNKLSAEVNIYAAARQYLSRLRSQKDQSKYEALKHARRRIAHFWRRMARLVDFGVLTEDEVLDSFEPDILELLEPFETIVAEDIRDLTQPKPWPAMRFYIAWLRRKGEQQKAAEWQATLPARPKLYSEYKSGGDKQASAS